MTCLNKSSFKEVLKYRIENLREIKNFLISFNWHYTSLVLFVYFGGFIGLYYLLTCQAKFLTYIWVYHMFQIGGIGLGPGAHRFFSHKSFKATRALKLFLIFCQTVAGQYTIILWSKVHRVHHKYADTEKDPTNIHRGFFFSHIYWVFHFTPEVKKALDTVDVDDLKADKDVVFQHKYYLYLLFICCIFMPTIIPYLLWNEDLRISFWANAWRWLMNYNQMSIANSIMHTFGKRPYDKNKTATENIFSILYTYGEGYHNYHHVFPWDYKAAEFGDVIHFNISTWLIDIWAKYGWVWDRRFVSQEMIDRRKARTGDGTHWLTSEEILKNPVWGYDDKDMDFVDKAELDAACNKMQ